MTITMFLSEVQQQTASVLKMCRSYIKEMENVEKSIRELALEPELKGKTYHSAKQYFNRTYIPLADGIILFK